MSTEITNGRNFLWISGRVDRMIESKTEANYCGSIEKGNPLAMTILLVFRIIKFYGKTIMTASCLLEGNLMLVLR